MDESRYLKGEPSSLSHSCFEVAVEHLIKDGALSPDTSLLIIEDAHVLCQL